MLDLLASSISSFISSYFIHICVYVFTHVKRVVVKLIFSYLNHFVTFCTRHRLQFVSSDQMQLSLSMVLETKTNTIRPAYSVAMVL